MFSHELGVASNCPPKLAIVFGLVVKHGDLDILAVVNGLLAMR